MSTPVILKTFTIAKLGTVSRPRLKIATKVAKGSTTVTFNQPIVDNDGAVITGDIMLAVRVMTGAQKGYVQNIYVPEGGMSEDGITASDVVKGLRTDSMIYDVGDSTKDVELPKDSIVECVWTVQQELMLENAVQGVIGTGADQFDIGSRNGQLVYLKFDNVGMIRRFVAPAFLTGGTGATAVPATWAAITNGSFRITIDGTARNIDAINFTGDATMDDVAATIQAAIRAVTGGLETVVWSTNKFIITSGSSLTTSAITVTSTSTGTVGTDISGLGGTAFLDAETGRGTVTNFVSKAQYSNDGSTWSNVETAAGHGSSAPLKDHSDVDPDVSDSPSDNDIMTYDLGSLKWTNTVLADVIGAAIQGSLYMAGTTGGSANNYTLTPSPAITALSGNQRFLVKWHATNTGASTINISGLGAVDIKKRKTVTLGPGDLLQDSYGVIVYNSTTGDVELVSPTATALDGANATELVGGGITALHAHNNDDMIEGYNVVSYSSITQVSENGFLVAHVDAASNESVVVDVFVDSVSPPTTRRAQLRSANNGEDNSICIPIPKNWYFELDVTSDTGSTKSAWFVPMS